MDLHNQEPVKPEEQPKDYSPEPTNFSMLHLNSTNPIPGLRRCNSDLFPSPEHTPPASDSDSPSHFPPRRSSMNRSVSDPTLFAKTTDLDFSAGDMEMAINLSKEVEFEIVVTDLPIKLDEFWSIAIYMDPQMCCQVCQNSRSACTCEIVNFTLRREDLNMCGCRP